MPKAVSNSGYHVWIIYAIKPTDIQPQSKRESHKRPKDIRLHQLTCKLTFPFWLASHAPRLELWRSGSGDVVLFFLFHCDNSGGAAD